MEALILKGNMDLFETLGDALRPENQVKSTIIKKHDCFWEFMTEVLDYTNDDGTNVSFLVNKPLYDTLMNFQTVRKFGPERAEQYFNTYLNALDKLMNISVNPNMAAWELSDFKEDYESLLNDWIPKNKQP